MAVVTFGTTARSNTAIAIKNNSTSNLALPFLRITVFAPNAVEYFTFNQLDDRIRYNSRQDTNYAINSNNKPYLDDVSEFAALVKAGTLTVYTTTQPLSSTTYVLGASAAFTTSGDGSVYFT